MRNYLIITAVCLVFPLMSHAEVIQDESGRQIEVTKPFVRIISLYGAHTENLFALGLDQEIIGVSQNEVYPAQALKKPVFSYHDDAEKFMAVRPDLVLIRPMIARGYAQFVTKLEKAGIAVVSLQPVTVEDMYQYWKSLGTLTGRQDKAEEMIRRFQRAVRSIEALVKNIPPEKRRRVYFEAIHDRMKTFSPNSMAMFALTAAGGINVAEDAEPVRNTNIAAYGKEQILARADEIEVYLAQSGTMNPVSKDRIAQEPGFQVIKAVKDGRIVLIDELIVSRPTLRLIQGIFEIGKALYPDVFTEKLWQEINGSKRE